MPCDQVRLTNVEFEAKNMELLEKAVEAMGGRIVSSGAVIEGYLPAAGSFSISRGKMTVRAGRERVVDQLKVAYSEEIVKKAASRFGWALSAAKTAGVSTAVRNYDVTRR